MKEAKITIIDIYAQWCSPCQTIAPILDKVSKELGIELQKVDIEKHPFASKQYNVKSVPTIIIERDGKEYARMVGVVSRFEAVLKEKIQNAIINKQELGHR